MSGLLVAACSSGDLAKGGKDSAASAAVAGLLVTGTRVQATIQDSISSRTNKPGAHVNAIVSRNVMDGTGRVVIPGGATILLTVAALHSAKGPAAVDGELALDVTSLTFGATTYTPRAAVAPVTHALLSRSGRDAAPTERDVIVSPGTAITITLTQPLKIAAN